MMQHSAYSRDGDEYNQDEDSGYLPYDFLPPPSTEHRHTSENDRSVTPTRIETILYITDHDVLCGRGAPNIHHPGNKYFRSLVKARQREYGQLRRQEKTAVVRSILNAIENRGGRFLRQLSCGEWVQVHSAIAYEKACQALREFQKTRNKSRKAICNNS